MKPLMSRPQAGGDEPSHRRADEETCCNNGRDGAKSIFGKCRDHANENNANPEDNRSGHHKNKRGNLVDMNDRDSYWRRWK
jgi:hypothetical protein